MIKFLQISLFLFLITSASASYAQKKGKVDNAPKTNPALSPSSNPIKLAGEGDGIQEGGSPAKAKNKLGIYLIFKKSTVEEEVSNEGLKEITRRFPGTQLFPYPNLSNAFVLVNKSPEFAMFQDAYANRFFIFSEADFELVQEAFPCAAEFYEQFKAYVAKAVPAK